MHVDVYVAARSKGHKMRELFDQYGNMLAFAVGYSLKRESKTIECWDILTSVLTIIVNVVALGGKCISILIRQEN